LVAAAAVLVVAGCAAPSAEPEAALPPVTREANIVSAEGVIVPHKSANLAFRVSGRVQQVLVAEGERVTVDTALMLLDSADLEQTVLQARAALESARAQLAKAEAGARVEEVAAAEAALQVAQASVTTAELAIDIARGNATSAEGALADAKAGVAAAEQAIAAAQGGLAAARASEAAAAARLDKLRAGATAGELAIAEQEVERAKNQLWAAQNQRDAIGGFDDESAEYAGAKGSVGSAEAAVRIAELNYQELRRGARAEDLAMAEADLAQASAAVTTNTAQVGQARAALESARARVTQAEASVVIAQAQLAQREADVQSAKAAAKQAEAQYDLVKTGTRSEDIAVARAGVAQAEASLAAAQNALDDATLRAPFDGTVGELLVEQGELVQPQITMVRFGDLTTMQVETTDLSEVDISAIQVRQPATVSVDALGGRELDGIVERIGTIAGDRRGDTVYQVIISLQDADVSTLRWGMSAYVTIKVR